MKHCLFYLIGFQQGNNDFKVTALNLTYYFYNPLQPNQPTTIKSNTIQDLKYIDFNAIKDTIILIHGWADSGQGGLVTAVRSALFEGDHDLNIIGVDWSTVWKNSNIQQFRATRAGETGKLIAEFLEDMAKIHQMDFSKVKIVCHSAGGPVTSAVGAALRGEIDSIVGLDTNNISPSDADFVQVRTTDCIFINFAIFVNQYFSITRQGE